MRRALRALALVAVAAAGLELALQGVHLVAFRSTAAGPRAGDDDDRFRILCIGESTTLGFPQPRNAPTTYPNQLLRRLESEFPQRRFDVSNQGIVGATTSGLLERLPAWLDAYRPHALVAMTGINDQFYHNVAYTDSLPTRALLALQRLRTYKLTALAWAQWKRSFGARPPAAFDAADLRRMLAVYERARADVLAGRLAPAEAAFVPLLEQVEALRGEDPGAGALGTAVTRLPVRAIGLYYEIHSMLAEIYLRTDRPQDAIALYERAIAAEPRLAGLEFEMARLHDRLGDAPRAEAARRRANQLLSEFVLASTVDNYRGIRDLAAERGIPLVAMQYPLRDVRHLKILLGEPAGVHFVDNRRSFERAVEAQGYEAIFSDAFAGDFGHLTPRGNALLVENLLDQALRGIVEAGAAPAR